MVPTLALVLLFALSIISNATPFFGASYTLLATTVLLDIGFNLESFAVVVFVTALGATLGKIFIYVGAKGFSSKLQNNKNVRLLGHWLGRSGFYVALFVTALMPVLPLDDYVYVGAGANNARLGPMLGVTFLAKLAKSAFEILLELSGIAGITHYTSFLGLSRLDFSLVLTVGFVVLGVIIYKVDWAPWVNGAARLLGRKPGPG